jgi:hypothetical protein
MIFADAGADGESAAAELQDAATRAGIVAEIYLPLGGDDFADDLNKGLSPGPAIPRATLSDPQLSPSETSELNLQAPPPRRPIVRVVNGDLPAIVNEAEDALIKFDDRLFQQGDFIVRPAPARIPIADDGETSGIRLVQVRVNHLIERMTYFANFQRFDVRKKKWIAIDCPPKIAVTYLERVGAWRLRSLVGFTVCPTLRPDGSILDRPGWDLKSGILYNPSGIAFPPIPAEPSFDDAFAALAKLKALIREFMFVGDADRSVSLSGMLTATIRRSLDSAPLHAFDAPIAGSGKSKLADTAAMISTGHEAPVISQGADEEELEKRVASMLLAGDAVINIDNCDEALGGSFLCQCLTQKLVKARVLGKSKTPTVAANATFFSTGNNLLIVGDLIRRSLKGRLDPQCERPELRRFETQDPVTILKRQWPEYLVAALTVLRAFDVAGRPSKGEPLGSFETWWGWVRGALVWLGEADPCDTIENMRAEDPRRLALATAVSEWHRVIGDKEVTVKQAIEKAIDFYPPRPGIDFNSAPRREYMHSEFRDALLAVAGNGGFIDPYRLGKFLSREKLKIINGLYITPGLVGQTWKVASRV